MSDNYILLYIALNTEFCFRFHGLQNLAKQLKTQIESSYSCFLFCLKVH